MLVVNLLLAPKIMSIFEIEYQNDICWAGGMALDKWNLYPHQESEG